MPAPGSERGRTGRIVYARVRPNEDLVDAVEALCREHGLAAAILRGSLGSLTQAALERGSVTPAVVPGPVLEILTLYGEVRSNAVTGRPCASLFGTLADPDGAIHGGRFMRGRSPVLMTVEIALEEWVVDEGRDGEGGA